jgi:hypothetical protein
MVAEMADVGHMQFLRLVFKASAKSDPSDGRTYALVDYLDDKCEKRTEFIVNVRACIRVLIAKRTPAAADAILKLASAAAMEAATKTRTRQLAADRRHDPDLAAKRRAVDALGRVFCDALKAWRDRNPEAARSNDAINSANLHNLAVTGRTRPLFICETASGPELAVMLEVLCVDIKLLGHDHSYAVRKPMLLEVAAKERSRLPTSSRLALAGPDALALKGGAQ